ncbi:aminoglycoside 6'-N-acetyltransferase [Paenibacillus sp. GP183]|jgi:aminoglycoside 6'-N-acetyltransferase I|uniref:aminoglycoside 6'-N-acetyltransferase n=1 Tax=Paenibacillus sp. GP183 TaxID=1882751 RepID=UPI000896C728|nr:aminoglycoside 6'-N-acetyltransferase [Paenibacillus sp. GP183]SEB49282.1 aminoglycoside 6'-N-acetyltransferase I [Paenibacillus sp. GP183]
MDKIVEAQQQHLDIFLEMGLDLWTDYDYEELRVTLLDILQSDKYKVLFYCTDEEFIAFIYLSVRTDYVEGSDSSPTGYIEGIYVKPGHRRKGISRKLLTEGEQWLKGKGCKQIGSDIYIDNKVSYDFHTSIGFKEAGRLIALIKDLE